jgi:AhpD family alkylhydroperoxidase
MTTIPCLHPNEAEGQVKEIYEEIMRAYDLDEPRETYMLMGHTPGHLAASWKRSLYIYATKTKLSLKAVHMLTLAISATNNTENCTRSHTARLEQLGMTHEEHLELLMVLDVMNGYDKFAEGTRAGDDPTIPYLSDDEADTAVEEVYADIKKAHGNKEPDLVYLLMGYKPEYLMWSWERGKLCFQEEGKLGLKLKHMIAICVAATNGNDYFVKVHTARLKELGVTDEELVEVLFLVDVVCGLNRYAQGMQVGKPSFKPFGPDAEANKAAPEVFGC